jgi:hypothetical protein
VLFSSDLEKVNYYLSVLKVKAANPWLALVEVDAGHNVGGDNPPALIGAVRPFPSSLER